MPRIKIIIRDGVLEDVRSDTEGLEVEAVQVDKDYSDYEKLSEYADQVYADPSLKSVNFTSINFEED